ncbi:hypothetical protein C8035_v010863 [Colletotrichum spinosum]|uniref:Uncharacterized protein n=1 Tax=Colletotrichum spinosum TaxID=1347390 RepID=A0A4R8QBX3_9PEZI|nr:hypothetical protein C8035_v010863 [Colletotrichum spinosum]
MSSPPPEEKPNETAEQKQTRRDKILAQAAAKLDEAQQEVKAAEEARQRGDAVEDPEEKKKIFGEASEHEKRAKALAKDSHRLQSGLWQGGISGAGIGAGIGTGLGAGVGTIVGAVVGGVASIPTTGLGLLIGAGTGAIHGPWYKLDSREKKGPVEEGLEEAMEEEKSKDGK